jgi:hypothetical protein
MIGLGIPCDTGLGCARGWLRLWGRMMPDSKIFADGAPSPDTILLRLDELADRGDVLLRVFMIARHDVALPGTASEADLRQLIESAPPQMTWDFKVLLRHLREAVEEGADLCAAAGVEHDRLHALMEAADALAVDLPRKPITRGPLDTIH